MIDRQQITEIARQAMAARKGLLTREVGYLFNHGRRVAALAVKLCDRVDPTGEINRDVLYTAGLFHDIGKCIDPHAEVGAELTHNLLQPACTVEERDGIAFIIREHNKRGKPDLPLAVHLQQDADVLDHFGAQCVWLCFLHNGYTETGPQAAVDFYLGEENQRYQARMRELLNLDISREIYDQRLAIERSFMQRFSDELNGAL
ncbi:MAG: HD domain-containing protein [Armatimonadota bacterium]